MVFEIIRFTASKLPCASYAMAINLRSNRITGDNLDCGIKKSDKRKSCFGRPAGDTEFRAPTTPPPKLLFLYNKIKLQYLRNYKSLKKQQNPVALGEQLKVQNSMLPLPPSLLTTTCVQWYNKMKLLYNLYN